MPATVCAVCGGGGCTPSPVVDYLDTYPFMPGGRPKVPGREGIDYVVATAPVKDAALERTVYGIGDRVPMADAIRYGLVDGPDPEPAPPPARGRRAKHGPAEDRAKHLVEDR